MNDYEKQQQAREFDAVYLIVAVAVDATHTKVVGTCLGEDIAIEYARAGCLGRTVHTQVYKVIRVSVDEVE